MNKSELILKVQSSLGGDTSKAQAERAIDAVLEAIKSGVKQAGKSVKMKGDVSAAVAVQLVGFGTFSVSRRNARSGVNPATGEKIKIKAAKAVKFKPGAGLKALV
jgi:nucleoid DNA-binding protein|tara:strand:+ start:42 stop:356 length:315 start_codon:yes stop_codon:yes gene_type:complete